MPAPSSESVTPQTTDSAPITGRLWSRAECPIATPLLEVPADGGKIETNGVEE